MIGNPPFLGGKLPIGGLGEEYVAGIFSGGKARCRESAGSGGPTTGLELIPRTAPAAVNVAIPSVSW